MGLFVTIRFYYTLVSEYDVWIGELIKDDEGAEEFAGYRNYAVLEGAIGRIEPGIIVSPRRNIFLSRHLPCVFTATIPFFRPRGIGSRPFTGG